MIRCEAFRRMVCCVVMTMVTMQVQAKHPASPLQPTTIKDWHAAGMDGTGCYWSARRNGPVFFAASGRTALTKIAGRVVVLAPAPRSREMFPFTHDAWTSDRVDLRVIAGRRIRALGEETVTTDATLIVTFAGETRQLRGSMICGS